MESRYQVHIIPAEWRWTMIMGFLLLLLAFVPYIVMLLAGTGSYQFMGMIGVNYRDGASYVAKMLQGVQGDWTIRFLHTPEPHDGFLLMFIYPLMGNLARISNLSPLVLFHLARIVASMFMFMAIYHLGATIWSRIRTRRIFFVLASIGAGFGWLLMPLTQDISYPDMSIPEMFPWFSMIVNVHFPAALACLALLAGTLIVAFRPGMEQTPNMTNGGLNVLVLGALLGLLYPQALIPLGGGLGLVILIGWVRARRIVARTFWWGLALAVPSVLWSLYYLFIVQSSPIAALWNAQNVTPAPNPLVLALGVALPLALGVPGIVRAARRFEQDGDQIMLLWLVVMVVCIYLPLNIQRRFAAGMMLPLAYFAARGIEDFWFLRVSRAWRTRLYAIFAALLALSPIFVVLVLMTLPLMGGQQRAMGMLSRDYAGAFQWLRDHQQPGDVVLAAPRVSVWLPGWTGDRVVFGHPFETLDAAVKERAVEDWYTVSSGDDCTRLLDGYYSVSGTYRISYVLVGPEELALGSDPLRVENDCLNVLRPLGSFGTVTIYGR